MWWTGSYKRYEMIQADILVKSVGVSEGLSQWQLAVTESASLRAAAHSSLRLSNPGQEAEVLSGTLKITKRVWSREEIIGPYSNLSCLAPSVFLSLSSQKLRPLSRIKCESNILIKKSVMVILLLYLFFMHIHHKILWNNSLSPINKYTSENFFKKHKIITHL